MWFCIVVAFCLCFNISVLFFYVTLHCFWHIFCARASCPGIFKRLSKYIWWFLIYFIFNPSERTSEQSPDSYFQTSFAPSQPPLAFFRLVFYLLAVSLARLLLWWSLLTVGFFLIESLILELYMFQLHRLTLSLRATPTRELVNVPQGCRAEQRLWSAAAVQVGGVGVHLQNERCTEEAAYYIYPLYIGLFILICVKYE